MRELNECKAEVFRRSEKRIKDRRRKNKRVLAFCIPLCFVLLVWSAMSISPVETEDSFDAAADEEEQILFDNTGEKVEYLYAELEIRKSDAATEKITDASEVARIFETVNGCFAAGEDIDNLMTETQPLPDMDCSNETDGDVLTEISIAFLNAEGTETVYLLKGNRLVNVRTNESAVLSEKQLSELKTALELTN